MKITPNNAKYFTYDELVERLKALGKEFHPDLTLRIIGKSREGRDIYRISLGNGDKTITAVGNMHADEPTGTVALYYLTKALLENTELSCYLKNFTFHFVPTANPDGLEKNKGWFTDSFNNLLFQVEHFRDLPKDDIEWSFPSPYCTKPKRPEQVALKSLFDSLQKINFYHSLHHSRLDSASILVGFPKYFRKIKKNNLIEDIKQLLDVYGMPLDKRDYEGWVGFVKLDDGIYSIPDLKDIVKIYDKALKKKEISKKEYNRLVNNLGISSVGYVQSIHNSPAFVTELPYGFDPKLNDDTETEIKRSDLFIKSIEIDKRALEYAELEFKKLEDCNLPSTEWFYNHIKDHLEVGKTYLKAIKVDARKFKKNATKAELFEYEMELDNLMLYYNARFARLCKLAYESTGKEKFSKMYEHYIGLAEEHNNKVMKMLDQFEPTPLDKIANAQAELILLSTKYV
jgi:hypothetical protein